MTGKRVDKKLWAVAGWLLAIPLAGVGAAASPDPNGPADLVLASIEPLYSGGFHEGPAVSFSVKIENVGNATGNFSVGFWIDNATIGSVAIPQMAKGSPGAARMMLLSPSWNATAGAHRLEARVDSNGEITETDETNNAATRDFRIKTKQEPSVVADTVDFRVTSITHYDSCYGWGWLIQNYHAIPVSTVIETSGYPIPGPHNATVTLLVDGATVLEEEISLVQNEPRNVTSPPSEEFQPGKHTYQTVLNYASGKDPWRDNDHRIAFVEAGSYGAPCTSTGTPTMSTTDGTHSTADTSTSPTEIPFSSLGTLLVALAGTVLLLRRSQRRL